MAGPGATRASSPTRHPASLLRAEGVTKSFALRGGERLDVLRNVDLDIFEDEIVVLLGRSGSGKSTLLRILAGLIEPSEGRVLYRNRPLRGVNPGVSLVFQSFALMPWLDVLANVKLGLEALGMDERERRRRALAVIDLVGLDGYEQAYPKELSGGMRQRVGVARALAVEPDVLLMDEPFSALDVLTAENLRGEILDLWTEGRIPTRAILVVTHNIEEAVLLADRIVILGTDPGIIRAELPVTLARPRDRKSVTFAGLVDTVYRLMTNPEVILEDVLGPAQTVPRGVSGPQLSRLPEVRPGAMIGLVELIDERGGQVDLYRLADELHIEADELLAPLDALVLLGFARVEEGDAILTGAGVLLARADLQGRKVLFREALVDHVAIIGRIVAALRAKADGRLPAEFFLDQLERNFTAPEAQAQLATAEHWGTFAELFEFDPDRDEFVRSDLSESPAA
ncbi:MAG: nitrate ABC transporter ATP-binding protein [Chloroflexota bacterium]